MTTNNNLDALFADAETHFGQSRENLDSDRLDVDGRPV